MRPLFLLDPVQRHHPLARGLAAWWLALPGLDGGRTWWDLVGHNHGLLTNMGSGSGWRGATRPGGWGEVRCDGTNDSVNCGNAPGVQLTGNLTASLWLRLAAQPSGAYSLVTKDKESGGRAFTLDYHNNGAGLSRLRWYINGGAGSNLIAGSAALTTGQWYHVVATYATTGVLALYVDGRLYASGTGAQSSIPSATANVTLGAREFAGNQDYFSGSLDDVALRARTLSAAEARALYDESRQGYPELLRRWDPVLPAEFRYYTGVRGGRRSVSHAQRVSVSRDRRVSTAVAKRVR